MHVLGIDVPPSLVERWRAALAPAWQPFFVDAVDEGELVAAGALGVVDSPAELADLILAR